MSGSRESHLVEHDPWAVGRKSRWGCMDDRPLKGNLSRPHFQSASPVKGTAQDAVVAAEMVRTGSVLATGRRGYIQAPTGAPFLYVIGSHIRRAGEAQGVELDIHDDCAGEMGSLAIARTIIDRPEDVLTNARRLHPGVTDAQMDKAYGITGALLVQGRMADPVYAAGQLESGFTDGDQTFPPIPRTGFLQAMPHVADTVLATHRPDVAFDTAAAMGDPTQPLNPAYAVSFGNMRELADPSANVLIPDCNRNTHLDYFVAAAAIRHGAIMLLLPTPEGVDSLTVELYE